MKRYLRLSLLCAALWASWTTPQLEGVTIVIHGTFACGSNWYQPRGGFFEAVRVSLLAENQGITSNDTAIIPFTWTGANNHQARIDGAHALAEVVLSYPKDEPVTLIGHSHAGNIIALFSRLIFNPFAPENTHKTEDYSATNAHDEEIIFKNYVEQEIAAYCAQADVTKSDPIASEHLRKQLEDSFYAIRSLYKKRKELALSKGADQHQGSGESQRKINRAFLLGTPVDEHNYGVNLKVVDTCYLFYSKGDMVQPVLGMYNRRFSPQKNILNLRTVHVDLKGTKTNPWHQKLHPAFVGRHLLSIPQRITQGLGISPQDYDKYKEVKITFFEDGREPALSLSHNSHETEHAKQNGYEEDISDENPQLMDFYHQSYF